MRERLGDDNSASAGEMMALYKARRLTRWRLLPAADRDANLPALYYMLMGSVERRQDRLHWDRRPVCTGPEPHPADP
ncbi:hypothetical protein ACNKHN_21095 [Shigella flexneri]